VDLVVCGHTPVNHYIGVPIPLEYFDSGQRVVNIDTFAQDLSKGVLSCLRLDDMQWYSTDGGTVKVFPSENIQRLPEDISE
jgi:hypothetical protein